MPDDPSHNAPYSVERGSDEIGTLENYIDKLPALQNRGRILHLCFSKLRAYNRRDQHLRAATDGLRSLVEVKLGDLFMLENKDVLFFFDPTCQQRVEDEVNNVRYLFSDDPVVCETTDDGRGFARWLDAATRLDEIRTLTAGQKKHPAAPGEQAPNAQPAASTEVTRTKACALSPDMLVRLEDALARVDLSSFTRNHMVVHRDEHKKDAFSKIFLQYELNVEEILATVLPDIDVRSDHWLYARLTETFDKRILSFIESNKNHGKRPNMGISLRARTLLSSNFISFFEGVVISGRGKFIISLPVEDIISDIKLYQFAKNFFSERDYRFCIDFADSGACGIIKPDTIHADFVRFRWNERWLKSSPTTEAVLNSYADCFGRDHIIVASIDNEDAYSCASEAGFRVFQGPYIDALMARKAQRPATLKGVAAR